MIRAWLIGLSAFLIECRTAIREAQAKKDARKHRWYCEECDEVVYGVHRFGCSKADWY
jgi:hypothetical protein